MPGSTYSKMVSHNITRDSAIGNCKVWLILAIEINLVSSKGGQTAILVRWSAAQRTTEMLADQRTGKIADQRQRTTEIELSLVRC